MSDDKPEKKPAKANLLDQIQAGKKLKKRGSTANKPPVGSGGDLKAEMDKRRLAVEVEDDVDSDLDDDFGPDAVEMPKNKTPEKSVQKPPETKQTKEEKKAARQADLQAKAEADAKQKALFKQVSDAAAARQAAEEAAGDDWEEEPEDKPVYKPVSIVPIPEVSVNKPKKLSKERGEGLAGLLQGKLGQAPEKKPMVKHGKLSKERKESSPLNALFEGKGRTFKKEDLNEVDEQGKTALIRAAEDGNVETINALLEAGADPNKTDKKDMMALDYAVKEDHSEIVKALVQVTKDRVFALMLAAMFGNVEFVRIIKNHLSPEEIKQVNVKFKDNFITFLNQDLEPEKVNYKEDLSLSEEAIEAFRETGMDIDGELGDLISRWKDKFGALASEPDEEEPDEEEMEDVPYKSILWSDEVANEPIEQSEEVSVEKDEVVKGVQSQVKKASIKENKTEEKTIAVVQETVASVQQPSEKSSAQNLSEPSLIEKNEPKQPVAVAVEGASNVEQSSALPHPLLLSSKPQVKEKNSMLRDLIGSMDVNKTLKALRKYKDGLSEKKQGAGYTIKKSLYLSKVDRRESEASTLIHLLGAYQNAKLDPSSEENKTLTLTLLDSIKKIQKEIEHGRFPLQNKSALQQLVDTMVLEIQVVDENKNKPSSSSGNR